MEATFYGREDHGLNVQENSTAKLKPQKHIHGHSHKAGFGP
jgi:hypothetical protein